MPGKVRSVGALEGARVRSGDTLFVIAPDSQFAWEALRALYWVGEREDLPLVERYADANEGLPELKQQAALTAKSIQIRMEGAGAR